MKEAIDRSKAVRPQIPDDLNKESPNKNQLVEIKVDEVKKEKK